MNRPALARIRLRQLMLVAALGETENLHRAAEAALMTQPTATKLLRDLEAALGARLFERLPRGMRATDLGREVVRFAKSVLGQMDRFAEDFDVKRRGGYGILTVGAIMGAAPDVVAGAVAAIKRRRPLLTVRLLGEHSDQILAMLAAGQLDIAVGRFNRLEDHAAFDFELLSGEPLVVVVRSGHPACERPPESLAALSDAAWILQPSSTPARQMLEREFSEAGTGPPSNVVESASIFAILQLLQTSDAVAMLPESVVRDHLGARLLHELPGLIRGEISGFGILRRKAEELVGIPLEFADDLRRIARARAA